MTPDQLKEAWERAELVRVFRAGFGPIIAEADDWRPLADHVLALLENERGRRRALEQERDRLKERLRLLDRVAGEQITKRFGEYEHRISALESCLQEAVDIFTAIEEDEHRNDKREEARPYCAICDWLAKARELLRESDDE